MSADINLLTKEEKVKQFRLKAVKASTLISILFLIISGGFSAYYYLQVRELKSSVEAVNNRVSSARATIDEMATVEIAARNLYQKYSIIEDILIDRPHYSFLLEHFEAKIPPGVSVESFSFRGDDEISISGEASSYITVSNFLGNLKAPEEAQVFEDASLGSASLNSADRTVSYSITIIYDIESLKGRY
jgi:Tfp pilus assembly protein PilN